ncbi:M81 family metallopeptidase [Paenibacillus sp. GYB003]|uniref:M81 family metallopeptidase n=1 Tax=Paenibacillus sp. GYB003 TaxID=2994392 RepID=UPI002F9697AB
MKIAIGGLIQESNTFSESRSELSDFRNYYFKLGGELLEPQQADNELAGFLQAAAAEGPDVELAPTLFTQAVSSGPVPRRTLDDLKRLLSERLDAIGGCDGVLFSLHGAWVAEDNDDADEEIVRLIRSRVGPDVPIVATLDSHANVTRGIVRLVDGIVGYRTFPHTDYAETGRRAARLLFRIVRGETKPHLRMKKVPMIVPAERHETSRGPMAELWAEALAGERDGRSGLASLFLVQPWLDVAEMGCSVVVMDDDPGKAEAEAERLAALMWSKRDRFRIGLRRVDEVAALLEAGASPGRAAAPIVVSDSADSPGAGSPGDSNYVLRELLRLGADRKWSCLLSMVDPEAAMAAAAAGEGSAVKLRVGHSISRAYGEPLAIEGTVARVGDGKFRFGGGTVAGLEANMGRCAVVRIGAVSLLLMERPTFTGDPAMYRSVGLEPADADLVLVKSAAQFRAEYEKLTDRIYILDTPGASTANLAGLPFKRIPRPMYPFDDFPTSKGDEPQ